MTGDKSDNIKGAEKIGPKTAAELINQFDNLSNIINGYEHIAKASVRESVFRNKERLFNNYKLIKLDDRAEIPFDLDELTYTYNGFTANEVLKGICLK